MSTSEDGFSLIELLVALAAGVLLALSVGPLWFSLQGISGRAADHVTLVGQTRVALARLERDLRLATRTDSQSGGVGPVLAATGSEVVLVVRQIDAGPLELVEWEVVGGALMRRRGALSGPPDGVPSHSWFRDHKTMFEGLRSGSGFRYYVGGKGLVAGREVQVADIGAVLLEGEIAASGAADGRAEQVRMWGRVAR